MKYIIHFFKENNRNMDINQLLIFFESYKEISLENKGDECFFHYQDNILNNSFDFIISKKSTVIDLHKLNPKFLDIKFRFEVDPFIPTFKMKTIFDIVLKLSKIFDIYVYNYLLKDVTVCTKEALFATYQLFNKAYYRKNKDFLQDFICIEEEKLNTILKYQFEINQIEEIFKEEDIFIPEGKFVSNLKTQECLYLVEAEYNVNTVFPPFLDILQYHIGETSYYFDYKILKSDLKKYLIYIPGAIKETFYMNPKKLKKINKYFNKNLKKSLDLDLEVIKNKKIIEKINLEKE